MTDGRLLLGKNVDLRGYKEARLLSCQAKVDSLTALRLQGQALRFCLKMPKYGLF